MEIGSPSHEEFHWHLEGFSPPNTFKPESFTWINLIGCFQSPLPFLKRANFFFHLCFFLGTINCAIHMSIFRSDIFVSPSETVWLRLMRQIIVNKDFPIGQRSVFKITSLLHRFILGIFETKSCQRWPTMEISMQWITV